MRGRVPDRPDESRAAGTKDAAGTKGGPDGAGTRQETHTRQRRRTPVSDGSRPSESERYWEEFYRREERVWSGEPNAILVEEATDLTPGTALDLGCGEGADAVWLARRGWQVTAVDVSRTALDRAARNAALAGVAGRIDWQRHDLDLSFPTGAFDLVSAQFLHSPVELAREAILRSAAAAVAPGGVLLVADHAGLPPWAEEADGEADPEAGSEAAPAAALPTPDEVLAALDLDPDRWLVESLDENRAREVTDPDGRRHTHTDALLRVRRVTV